MDEVAYDLVDKKLAPVLSRVQGVAKLILLADKKRNSSESGCSKMQAYGLSIQVTTDILSSNLDFPRKHSNSRTKILIRLAGNIKNVEELRNLIVSSRGGIKFV
jgi:HAE1 family hydrophobic/amphiphilic exporter-1